MGTGGAKAQRNPEVRENEHLLVMLQSILPSGHAQGYPSIQ